MGPYNHALMWLIRYVYHGVIGAMPQGCKAHPPTCSTTGRPVACPTSSSVTAGRTNSVKVTLTSAEHGTLGSVTRTVAFVVPAPQTVALGIEICSGAMGAPFLVLQGVNDGGGGVVRGAVLSRVCSMCVCMWVCVNVYTSMSFSCSTSLGPPSAYQATSAAAILLPEMQPALGEQTRPALLHTAYR